ncbi:hypothetical protein EDD16DRAFT_1732786 [Pisolithus croceorrhizus]|nr:hypothetical protein EDD16DRAFT_1732786 [Pisolithus croceorrhizus]
MVILIGFSPQNWYGLWGIGYRYKFTANRVGRSKKLSDFREYRLLSTPDKWPFPVQIALVSTKNTPQAPLCWAELFKKAGIPICSKSTTSVSTETKIGDRLTIFAREMETDGRATCARYIYGVNQSWSRQKWLRPKSRWCNDPKQMKGTRKIRRGLRPLVQGTYPVRRRAASCLGGTTALSLSLGGFRSKGPCPIVIEHTSVSPEHVLMYFRK